MRGVEETDNTAVPTMATFKTVPWTWCFFRKDLKMDMRQIQPPSVLRKGCVLPVSWRDLPAKCGGRMVFVTCVACLCPVHSLSEDTQKDNSPSMKDPS